MIRRHRRRRSPLLKLMSVERQLTQYFEQHLPSALHLLELMVGINSFTANAAGVNELGRLTAAAFQPLDLDADFVPSGRPEFGAHLFLTRRGSSDLRIALVSHLDTVFPPEEEQRNNFRWLQEANRIYGPGT